ncbi:MAG: bifunctional glutamate N-acetyltransferase/amino-acid acetyltransferase ArgJ [Opitutales bacterium]|nr:bifunctional glutamate N-acetyltransferase/amino-acid acetyltransferase ArgJ [Opitutales bacterium]
MSHLTPVNPSHGLVDVPGFRVGVTACDIRNKGNDRLDLTLLASDRPAAAAAVFTRNRFAAAPVLHGRRLLAGGRPVRAIVANSGNANACTGQEGMADTETMAAHTASALGCEDHEVFVCSTGRIGERLPMERIKAGIARAATGLSDAPEAGCKAADAILTSDTRRKVVTVRTQIGGRTVTVAGIAKGAGMIQPDMATMLAFIATDASIPAPDLQSFLTTAVGPTFNAVTVDGDTSTNDTVLLLANHMSGVTLESAADRAAFAEALLHVCDDLARKIVGDGEKITKVVDLRVEGAATQADAEKVARTIGNSLLVKSSWFGGDPNWGRLLDAAGYAGVDFDPDRVVLDYLPCEKGDPVPVFAKGQAIHANKPLWKALVAAPQFGIRLHLGGGEATFRLLASDLTDGYVNFNKSE